MSYAPIAMIPGPVQVPASIREVLARDHGCGQNEEEFLPLYHATSKLLAYCMSTENDVVIMTGEGMLALWAGLKSCLAPGDRVLAIGTGVFGDGIGDMAESMGCEVKKISFPYNATVPNSGEGLKKIEEAIVNFKPHMITAVHCETPSGTLNPLEGLGALKKAHNVPLFYVDAVSSLGGTPVLMDAWHIDILLGASQKCLSAPPNLSFLGLSQAAWQRVAEIKYQGYDALLPWQDVRKTAFFPYTPYWAGVAALHNSLQQILDEGLEKVYERHRATATLCREGLEKLGCSLWPLAEAVSSPTVTAACVPKGIPFATWQQALRVRGLSVGGSFGPMEGKVFRMGHMGCQAKLSLVKQALDIIEEVLHEI